MAGRDDVIAAARDVIARQAMASRAGRRHGAPADGSRGSVAAPPVDPDVTPM
jgi:hypothetical protein